MQEPDRLILLRIEAKLDQHIQTHNSVHLDLERRLGDRPSLKVILSLFGLAGTLSGIIFGILAVA